MADQPRKPDRPMTTPDKWGTGQPENLREALTSVRSSYDLVTEAKKPKGTMGDHVAAVEDAADTLLAQLKEGSSGDEVRQAVARFNAKTKKAQASIAEAFTRGGAGLGPVGALLGSIQQLDSLAQNL
jgi:hypothetical protein